MKLGKFIETFIEPNSIIRLVYKTLGGYQLVLDNWDDVSMEWEVTKCRGKNRHYIDNNVIGVTSIATSGNYKEAINIVIEKKLNQVFLNEKEYCYCGAESNYMEPGFNLCDEHITDV